MICDSFANPFDTDYEASGCSNNQSQAYEICNTHDVA